MWEEGAPFIRTSRVPNNFPSINWTMFTYGINWVTYGTPNLRMYHEVSTQLIGNFYKKNKPTLFLLLCGWTN